MTKGRLTALGLISVILWCGSLRQPTVIQRSVVISTSTEKVWNYLSDNNNASQWSVYFDHISDLPATAVPGSVGSMRRCFRNVDESGMKWDEVVLQAIPYELREIETYNTVGYGSFDHFTRLARYRVEQRYRQVAEGVMELKFSVRAINLIGEIILTVSRAQVADIFGRNLENIRDLNQPPLHRLHPYDATLL